MNKERITTMLCGKERRGDRLWRAAGLCGERSNVPREALLYGAENDDKLRTL